MQFVEKFKIELSQSQSEVLEEWAESCKVIWNKGLSLLLFQQRNTAIAAVEMDGKWKKVLVPCCNLNQSYFCNKIDSEKVFAPHSWIIDRHRNGGTVNKWDGKPTHKVEKDLIRVGQCCPLKGQDYQEPKLGFDVFGKYTLQYWFTQKNMKIEYPEHPGLISVPAWFVRGVCSDLSVAWQRYLKGEAGVPRFKNQPTSTLSHGDAKKLPVRLEGKDGFISIPKIGEVKVLRMAQRWGDRPIAVLEFVKDDDDCWRIHLTGLEIHLAEILSPLYIELHRCINDLSSWMQLKWLVWLSEFSYWSFKRNAVTRLKVPVDGYKVAIDDRGKEYNLLPLRHTDQSVDPHGLIATLDEKILHIERAIAVQRERLNLDRQNGDTNNKGNRLKQNEKRLKKLRKRKTAILHNNRKKMAHFISERSACVVIDLKQEEQTRQRKPKPKPAKNAFDPGEFDPNGATAIAEKNKKDATSAPGEFVALIKAEAAERSQKVFVNSPKKVAKKAKKR